MEDAAACCAARLPATSIKKSKQGPWLGVIDAIRATKGRGQPINGTQRLRWPRECLLIRCERSWSSAKVISALADVMVLRGIPEHVRSDNGPEFVAKGLRMWLAGHGR